MYFFKENCCTLEFLRNTEVPLERIVAAKRTNSGKLPFERHDKLEWFERKVEPNAQ